MGNIFKSGNVYDHEERSIAELAIRALHDGEGNNIKNTYYADTHKKFESLENFQTYSYSDAGSHNAIFMGRNLTSRFNSGDLYTQIANGSFRDMYVGDYFTKTINSKSMTCRFAGFDLYGTVHYPHHAVIVPDQYFFEAKMNDTHTTVGAYKGSKMHKTYIPQINSYLQSAFGSAHLVTIKDFLSNAVNSSIVSAGYRGWTTASSSWELTDSIAELMSEVEVYGTRVWSSSGYDIGMAKSQFPLFALAPSYINPGRFSWWLRSITSECMIGFSEYFGIEGCGSGDRWSFPVRPRWCIRG